MVVTTGMFVGLMGGYLDFGLAADIGIYILYLFMSIAVTVIAHNHNHLPILAEDAMKQTRLLVNNPREVSYDDALAIYRAAYSEA